MKPHLRRFSNKQTWMQPQWVCHTIFIMLLFLSQIALYIFVVTKCKDTKDSKLEKNTLQNNPLDENNHIDPIDNGSSLKLEIQNSTQLNEDLKMIHLQSDVHNMDPNVLKRVHSLETNIKSLKKVFSNQGEEIRSLQSIQQSQWLKYEKALERQFNNMTTALNSLQNRLEEGLDVVFSQISQLRDDVYFIENSLNQTKQGHLGINETILKPTRVITDQPLTDSRFTTSQIADVTEKTQTSVQPVSKQNPDPQELYHISVSFLKSRADFQVFFYGADKDADGYLTYDEMKNVLGDEAPDEELLQQFDRDQNKMYSYTELIRTFFLKDGE
ncbi:EF-hand calcium-binding domain-containing protein 14-like [Hyperolius riggenbachi]|uniref:EF-hand calcium-binding domain-containing protein 14-like n=1 Tax=Hyperolius riggenbachi TaxID=752182 RepID=UPI0035A2D249